MVNATSFAVNGSPSCHLTPGCRWNVQTRPSGLISHESARAGTGFHVVASQPRSTSLSNMSWKLIAWLNVSCEAGCQIAVRSPSQCIWSVSAAVPPALAAGEGDVPGLAACEAGAAPDGDAAGTLPPHAPATSIAVASKAKTLLRIFGILLLDRLAAFRRLATLPQADGHGIVGVEAGPGQCSGGIAAGQTAAAATSA